LSASRRAAILRYWAAGVLLVGVLAAEIV